MLNKSNYVLASLRYTGDILDELLKRAENFKLEEDRAEFMINQAYRYFPVYDVKVKRTCNETISSSIEESIKNSLVEMYGENIINADEIMLDYEHRLKNETYWLKLDVKCDKSDGVHGAINSGDRLVIIKCI